MDDDFYDLYTELIHLEAIIWITPVYWHEMSEAMSSFISRIRRSDPLVNHYLQDKPCIVIACAGKTGNGAVRTVYNMEYIMGQLKMIVRDRLPVTPFNKNYLLDTIRMAAKELGNSLV